MSILQQWTEKYIRSYLRLLTIFLLQIFVIDVVQSIRGYFWVEPTKIFCWQISIFAQKILEFSCQNLFWWPKLKTGSTSCEQNTLVGLPWKFDAKILRNIQFNSLKNIYTVHCWRIDMSIVGSCWAQQWWSIFDKKFSRS